MIVSVILLAAVGTFLAAPRVLYAQEEEGDTLLRYYLPIMRQLQRTFLPFAALMNAAPAIADDPWPMDASVEQSLNPDLIWQAGEDPEGDAYVFEVYLEADDDTPDELFTATADSFIQPTSLAQGTQYYWQVVSVDERGGRTAGPVWTFKTLSIPDPPDVGSMVYVPEGSFTMGCDGDDEDEIECYTEELPLHRVYLDAYFFDKYEVTNKEYRACVDAGVCDPPRLERSLTRDNYFTNPAYDYFPVLYVSWWDGQTYCGWVGKRLPTEAEWEKAARGSMTKRVWPWGDELLSCERAAKFPPNGHCLRVQDMLQVGSYPNGAGAYGALDMGGNAFEWVQDKYDHFYYHYSPPVNPQGPPVSIQPLYPDLDHPLFVIRGGSNVDNWYYMRSAHRHWGHHGDGAPDYDRPLYRSFRVGFRCARSAEPGEEPAWSALPTVQP